MVLFLDDAAVHQLVTMDDALVAVRASLTAQGLGRAHNAARRRARSPGSVLAIMGGAVESIAPPGAVKASWSGAKLSVTAQDKKKAWMLLFDGEGVLRCLLVANRLGQLRTGAATGVSTDVLARPDASVLACLGAGYQAWTQVEAVTRVRSIQEVRLWSRTTQNASAFADRLRTDLGLRVEVHETPAEAVAGADIIVTVTAAASAILSSADVAPWAHVVLAGSNHPDRREADSQLFARARQVYADDLEHAMDESGDLRMAVADGALAWSDVNLLGKEVARAAASDGGETSTDVTGGPTVFCSQGIGSWDVSLAAVVHGRALERHVGVQLPIDGSPLSALS